MRIAIVYPPYRRGNKVAFLPQNRQFVYSSSEEVRLYPVIAATAATMLKNGGHQVLWLDGITENLTEEKFWQELWDFKPDLILTETKAPVIIRTWDFINKLKAEDSKLKTVLVGDHVTFYPEESLEKSKVDYVLAGGDWDFLLINLVNYLDKKEKLEPGIWDKGLSGGKFKLNHNLDKTPIIDRNLTKFQLYKEADVLTPCAYMMFGRGCAGAECRVGTCTFCIWQHSIWKTKARLRSPEHVVREIKDLLSKYKIKEIFDDTDGGAHYDYQWLCRFYELLKKEKLLGKVSFSTNSRADVLDKKTCQLLKQCGFRMLKVGVESGSNETLKKIAKNEVTDTIERGVKNAKDAGLIVHLSAMVGYPWEKEKEAKMTYKLMKKLLLYKTRVGDSVQASVIVPYPGTPLWLQAKKEGWLLVTPEDYEMYDMTHTVLKNKIDTALWCKKIWNLHLHPLFLVKTVLAIRSIYDLKFLVNGAMSHFGHTKDYD